MVTWKGVAALYPCEGHAHTTSQNRLSGLGKWHRTSVAKSEMTLARCTVKMPLNPLGSGSHVCWLSRVQSGCWFSRTPEETRGRTRVLQSPTQHDSFLSWGHGAGDRETREAELNCTRKLAEITQPSTTASQKRVMVCWVVSESSGELCVDGERP